MHLFMKGQEKKKFIARSRALYSQARTRTGRSRIIDDLMQYVGYKSRKHAIRILSNRPCKRKTKRRGRNKKPTPEQVAFIVEIRASMGYPCAKLMQPALQDWISAWKKSHPEVQNDECYNIPEISSATIDRILRQYRVKDEKRGEGKQSPTRLKKSIPLVNRNEVVDQSGYCSADTVALCGESTEGDFVWMLMLTDELTLWSLARAIWNKGQYAACNAPKHCLRELPFRVRRINTDNGSEFINHHLQRFLKTNYKTCKVTRSRPDKKNDNARVEERNRRLVRDKAGYERFGDERFVKLPNGLYRWQNDLTNHFTPVMRLLRKERVGSKVIKVCDKARTPYARLIEIMPEGRRKEKLMTYHRSLDPWLLKAKIQAYADKIVKLFAQQR